jgi:hypothetical protein
LSPSVIIIRGVPYLLHFFGTYAERGLRASLSERRNSTSLPRIATDSSHFREAMETEIPGLRYFESLVNIHARSRCDSSPKVGHACAMRLPTCYHALFTPHYSPADARAMTVAFADSVQPDPEQRFRLVRLAVRDGRRLFVLVVRWRRSLAGSLFVRRRAARVPPTVRISGTLSRAGHPC